MISFYVSIVLFVIFVVLLVLGLRNNWNNYLCIFFLALICVSIIEAISLPACKVKNEIVYDNLSVKATSIHYEIEHDIITGSTIENILSYNKTIKEHKDNINNPWNGGHYSKEIASLDYISEEFFDGE